MTRTCNRFGLGVLGVCLTFFAAATVVGQEVGVRQVSKAALAPSLTCVVQGTPVEFPDDILIKNSGVVVVSKGTKIHWQIPNTSRQGDYTFDADLAPGASKMLSGVLPGGHPAGAVCTVTIKPTLVHGPVVAVPVKPSFTCVVQGTPVEFPDDIVIKNSGVVVVAKGTKIHWQLPNTSRQGDYTFDADLAPGASKMLSGVLPGGHPAGAACTVKVM